MMSGWAHTLHAQRILMRTKWWYRYFWSITLKHIKNLRKTKNVFSKNRKVVQEKYFYTPFEILITWIDRSRCVELVGNIDLIWIYREKSKIEVKVIKFGINRKKNYLGLLPSLRGVWLECPVSLEQVIKIWAPCMGGNGHRASVYG